MATMLPSIAALTEREIEKEADRVGEMKEEGGSIIPASIMFSIYIISVCLLM